MKISDIVEFNPTRTLKKGTLASFVEMAAVPEYVRDIAYVDEKEFSSGSKFKNGDTLFARITPCLENGKAAKVNCLRDDEIAHGSTEFIVMAPRSEDDEDFVYYLSRDPEFREFAKSRMQGTSGRQRVSWQSLADYELPDIEPTIRKRIGEILKSFDDKIALNREINKTLEAMAQAIFKSWFVDFEPFKEGKFVESELGMIPQGWEVSTIGAETTSVGGATPSTTNPDFWEDGEFYWATPKDLSALQEKVLVGTDRKITNAGVKKISSGQLPIGTVLLSSRAPIGYLALTTIPVSINQGFIAMVCNKRLPNTYVLQWATSKLDDIKQRGSGTTFAEISKSTFRPIQVLVPNKDSLQKYDEIVSSYYKQISINVQETQTLSALRDTLLPKLLSGEIEV